MEKQTPGMTGLAAWSLVGELGFIIAIPLVVAVIAGVSIDHWLHTTPLCLFIALGVSFSITAVAIVRKVRMVMRQTTSL